MKFALKNCMLFLSLALFAGCGDFEWFPDSDTTSAVNIAPVANAGTAQSVIVGDSVAIDGSGSSDANGDALTYSWTLTSPAGSAAALSSTTLATPTFTADVAGAYILSLTVNDGKVSSPAANVTVTAFNTPPTANAGPDQSVIEDAIVILDGSASSGANLIYNWSFTKKPDNAGNVLLSSATVANPTFTPTFAGVYEIELIVKDRISSSTADLVTVTVAPGNTGSITVTW